MTAKLTETEAHQRMRDAGLLPSTPYPGTMKPWPSVCLTCGNPVSPTLNSVGRRGTGCKWCGACTVLDDIAVGTMLAAGLLPSSPYPGTMNPWP